MAVTRREALTRLAVAGGGTVLAIGPVDDPPTEGADYGSGQTRGDRSTNDQRFDDPPGSRMRPPAERRFAVRLAASATSQRITFDGKPIDLVLR
jgi:hypothetical protein